MGTRSESSVSPDGGRRSLPRRPRRSPRDRRARRAAASSISPRSSATAIRTSPTASIPADVQLARVCEQRFSRSATGTRLRSLRTPSGSPAARRAGADRRARPLRLLPPPLGGARARPRGRPSRCEAPARRAILLPPGRGRGSSVGSIVCFLTGLSHVDPVSAGLALGRFLNRELVAVPDIDLDFPRDIREKLIVAVIEKLRPRAHRARGELLHVPLARGDP